MSSRTARTRPASATASTRSRSTSSRLTATRASVPDRCSAFRVWHRSVSRSVRFAHVFRTQGGERERRREVRQARKRHRRERRGRAARHRLHLHRRPDLEPDRPVPALLGHAGRHAPAVGRAERHRGDREPEQQGQRHDAGRERAADRVRALDELARAHGSRREEHEPRSPRLPLRGPGAEQPERRVRQVGRVDLVLRPVVRAHARLRRRARARARLAGRLPRRPGRRRPGARRRQGRVRAAERPLLLARRVAALHQRHPEGVDQGLRRRRGQHPLERPAVLRRASARA